MTLNGPNHDIPKRYKILLIGNLNAKVVQENIKFEGTEYKHRPETINNKNEILVKLECKHGLLIKGIIFFQK